MENIIVCDNFLDKEELTKAVSIINSCEWQFGHQSLSNQLFQTPFWSCDLINNPFFSKTIFNIIEKHFSKKFKIHRLYANGQTFGQNGSYHIDSDKPNTYTFCLYLSEIKKEYIETAGGNLYFKFPDKKYQICYEPIFNRGILFPSNYLHKAYAFNRYIMNLRICVAWKLEEII